jgi:hypothetical protein
MIITRLKGGLGNQMFQYAAGLTLATRHETPLLVDLSFLETDAAGRYTQRNYELNVFKADIQFASAKDLSRFNEQRSSALLPKFKKMLGLPAPSVFREKNSRYDSELGYCADDTLLIGFWQSEKYFEPMAANLRAVFNFKEEFKVEASSIERGLSAATSISVHIRRGDYVQNKSAGDFHGICSPAYYQTAMNQMCSKFQDVHFYIFSDDLAWCRENINSKAALTFVQLSNAASEMYLMSRCSHHIIANSSFSWWAAWLNASPSKVVIAPQPWFQDAGAQTQDIYCKDWIRIA